MNINKKEAAALLVRISEWCVSHKLGSGFIHDTPDGSNEVGDSIFINGNLARVLTCTYEITGEESFLREAVSWCDYFVESAIPIKTSKGNDAVWWWDMPGKNLYLADTGTAAHALFKVFPYLDDDRKTRYLDTFSKFYLLIAEGTDCDPMDRGQEASPGWIIDTGKDAGAFGVGYRKGQLETRTYTVSTACAGAQASAALYKLTKDEICRKTALDAAYWLLGQFDDTGNIPYRIEGKIEKEFVFQGLHYSLEGLLTSYLYLDDDNYRRALENAAPKIMEFALASQNAQGFWGIEREYDGQRSAFLAHFLNWYCENINDEPRARAGAELFASYILNPDNTSRHGVGNLVRVTGFIGLVVASFLYPELDIRHPEASPPLYDFSLSRR
ncbi:MAG: hypothetical protein HN368_07790 [Spirochaetales bacterium]|jgi:hypothetical protein|nr:hypothetical protein [Spirochaetales bacterium]